MGVYDPKRLFGVTTLDVVRDHNTHSALQLISRLFVQAVAVIQYALLNDPLLNVHHCDPHLLPAPLSRADG